MKSPILAAVSTVILVSLAVSGCTAGSGEESEVDRFVFATGEPDHLTPGRQTVAFDQVQSVFAPLVAIGDDNEIEFVQAESVTSDDATTWTITLRDGWTFQNGEAVTSSSYVDAWNATAYGPNAWENSGQLASIVGYSDLNPAEGEPTVTTMSGLQVVDDQTFTVQLVGPDSQFPLQLSAAQTAFYPMPKAAFDDPEAYDRQPIGNGPYEMTGAWEDNTEFTVQAYADYQGDKPKTSEIVFRPYSDMTTAYTDVLAGNADVLLVPPAKLTSAGADFGDRLLTFDAPGVDYLGFPSTDARYADKRVRQAISMSIDRDAVNTAIYGGIYEPATSLTAPSMAGTPKDNCAEFCEFHPEDAKKLLAEAGGFSGTMEIVYPGGIGLDSLFEAYANQIRQNLGIADVVAKPTTDWAEYWSSLTGNSVAGPHFGHWGALYPSQQNTLRNLFTATGACFPCTGYSNPAVDSLLAQADAAPTLEESYDLYATAQDTILDDFPTVPTFSSTYAYVISEHIKSLPAVIGTPVLSRTTVQ